VSGRQEEGENAMRIVCGWCGKPMGKKKGKGTTHGIYKGCAEKIEKAG